MSFYRYDGNVRNPTGEAVPGTSVAVLTQPASFVSHPGSPLATIYAASASNSATITAAVWSGQQITFTFNSVPADVIAGSFIAVSGVTPSAFNTTLEDPYLVVSVTGLFVVVLSLASPGTYVSGGTVATSVLPNPTATDGNGNYFFYAAAGIYSVQIYGPTIMEQDLPDQSVGTVSGAGTVTSVALALPASTFSISGSPVTSTGTLTGAFATQTANYVFAGPASGSAATPTWRTLVAADIPTIPPRVPTYTLTGTTDALTYPGANFVTTGAIDNTTLATPTAGADDGKIVTLIAASAFAHTITTSANKIVPNHHVVTFGGNLGTFVELMAYSGLWYPLANGGGIVIS